MVPVVSPVIYSRAITVLNPASSTVFYPVTIPALYFCCSNESCMIFRSTVRFPTYVFCAVSSVVSFTIFLTVLLLVAVPVLIFLLVRFPVANRVIYFMASPVQYTVSNTVLYQVVLPVLFFLCRARRIIY